MEIYLHDTTYEQHNPIYSKFLHITLCIKELNVLFKKFSRIKKKIKSLKNICTQVIMNSQIEYKKGQIPDEILEYIINYKRKHRHLFPTFYTKQRQIKNAMLTVCRRIFTIPLSNNEYYRYSLKDELNLNFTQWLSLDLDNRLNLHVTDYIRMGSRFNLNLRKNPNIDLPVLNYLPKN